LRTTCVKALLALSFVLVMPLHCDDWDKPLPGDDPKAIALVTACDKGTAEDVKKLIAAGAPVDGQVNKYRYTPLVTAAGDGHADMIKVLLDAKANPNLPDVQGSTALLHACNQNATDAALALINGGADVNQASNFGRTPLMYAADKGNGRIVQAMIAHHVKLDATCSEGTAINWAAARGHFNIVKLLGDAGANVNLVPPSGHTQTNIGQAIGHYDMAMLDYLEGLKADVNLPDSSGETPVMLAISYQNDAALANLLAHGASPDALCKNGETPLIYAVRQQDTELIHTLIKGKADVNRVDADGETALTIAGSMCLLDYVKLLQDAGAKRTDLHVVVRPSTAPQASPRQEWALAVGAIYCVCNGNNPRVLGGDDAQERSKMALITPPYQITNKAELLATLDQLRKTGDHAPDSEKGAQLDRMSDADFQQQLAARPEDSGKLKAMRQSYRKWKERTGLGFDLCRAANLVSAGYQAGYINDDEAWEQLTDIARTVQKNFTSWREFGENFLDGREINHGVREARYDACVQLLLEPKDANSPWNRCPWNTAFPAEKH